MRVRCLPQRLQTGQVALFEELERRATAGRDVVDVLVETELRDRSRAVAAADNSERAAVGDRLGDGPRSCLEASVLEHAHRPVPENRARLADHICELGGGART